MLSFLVNDAFIGIDVMKKYPAFYAQMLIDKELRTSFLDTLEILEESSAKLNQSKSPNSLPQNQIRFPPHLAN